MSNALTTTTAAGLPSTGAGNPFLDAADDMGASSGALFLKFDGNTGEYTYGKDQEELSEGTRVAVAASEFKNGWICWKDQEVVGEVMVRIVDGKPPAKHTLEDHGPYDDEKDGWSEQSSAQFRDIETGEEFLYKTSSKGGRIALGNLVRDYGKQFQLHPSQVAIVELGTTSFDAKDKKTGKKLGRKYAPVFKIVEWMDEDELVTRFAAMEDAGDEDAGEDAEIPVNTGKTSRRGRNFG